MTNQQIDKKRTKQVRIDTGIHKLAKVEAAKSGETIRSLTEYGLGIVLGIDKRKSGDKDGHSINK